jgi:ParB-like chromosome segregation protein Spo0J
MVKLLKCEEHIEGEEFLIKIDQLHSLEEVGILANPDMKKAMRGVSKQHVERLMFSDPNQWAPIVVTLTDRGWITVDGYHRVEAMKYKGVKEIRAVCQAFEAEIEVIRAAYRANREHGLPIPPESRSAYAYVLHIAFPTMTQEEIGAEAGISQPTVSIAISRRDEKKATEQKETPKEKPAPDQLITLEPQLPPEERVRESARKDWQTIAHDVRKLLEDTKDEEGIRRVAMMEALGNIQERDDLLEVAREIQAALAPPTPLPPTKIPRTPRKKGQ